MNHISRSSIPCVYIIGMADLAPRGPPPNIATPSHQPLNGSSRCHGGSNIKEEHGLPGRLRRARVIVNDVPHFRRCPIDIPRDEPVVAVERGLGPKSRD